MKTLERLILYLLLYVALLFAANPLNAQNNITGNNVKVNGSLQVKDNAIDSISKDPNMLNNSDRTLPTQKAVTTYVIGKISTGSITWINPRGTSGVTPLYGNADSLYPVKIRGFGGITVTKTADSFYVDITGPLITNTATLNFPSTAAGAVSDLTMTVTGAAVGDVVSLGIPAAAVTATGMYTGWVSSANTVTIRFSPKATENPASATFKATIIKF